MSTRRRYTYRTVGSLVSVELHLVGSKWIKNEWISQSVRTPVTLDFDAFAQGRATVKRKGTWCDNPYSRVRQYRSYCSWLLGFKRALK